MNYNMIFIYAHSRSLSDIIRLKMKVICFLLLALLFVADGQKCKGKKKGIALTTFNIILYPRLRLHLIYPSIRRPNGMTPVIR